MLDRLRNLFSISNNLSNEKEKTKISSFRNRYDWQALEKRYYDNLDFINYFEKPEKIRRKKQILESEVSNRKYYSICYLTDEGYVVRIDKVGGYMPTETHLIWQKQNLIEVYEFALGDRGMTKVYTQPQPVNYWTYKYDDQGLVSQIFMVDFEDFTYYAHGKNELRIRYEYDQNGLARSYRQLFNFPPPLYRPEPVYKEFLFYDRDYQDTLSKSTVCKTPYRSTCRKPKKAVLFKRQIYTLALKKVPVCPKCGEAMDYVGYVDLRDPRIKKKSSLVDIPIFFCFNCLQWETFTFDFQNKPNFKDVQENDIRLFPEAEIDFIKATGKEEEDQNTSLVKIGGMPNWIQDEEWPICPDCKNKMLFVCQINTDENISNGKYCQVFGDSGMLYVFTCCKYISTVMQCG
jgi:hypothetical protein